MKYAAELDSGIDIPKDKASVFAIADRFESLSEVTKALKKVGMDECGLIFGMWKKKLSWNSRIS